MIRTHLHKPKKLPCTIMYICVDSFFYELMFINSVKSANRDFPSRPKHIFIIAFFYIAVNNEDRKNSGIDKINEI